MQGLDLEYMLRISGSLSPCLLAMLSGAVSIAVSFFAAPGTCIFWYGGVKLK